MSYPQPASQAIHTILRMMALTIEFVGALIIVVSVGVAIARLLRNETLESARLAVAGGVVNALSFELAGTLLTTVTVHTWRQIATFAVVFAIRTLLKRLFSWEYARLVATSSLDPVAPHTG